MTDILQHQRGRYDGVLDEFVEERQKEARRICQVSLAHELRAVSGLRRGDALTIAEEYCTRKGLIRVRGSEPDTPEWITVCLAAAAIALVVLLIVTFVF